MFQPRPRMRGPGLQRRPQARIIIEHAGTKHNKWTIGIFGIDVRPAHRAKPAKLSRHRFKCREKFCALDDAKMLTPDPRRRVALRGVRLAASLAVAVPQISIDAVDFADDSL